MANTKISAFTSGAPAQSTDEFVIARAGANYKLANSDIKTFTIGAGSVSIASGKTLTGNSSLTLAGTDGKTLTVNNTLTLAGTDSTTMTFPATSGTVATLNTAQTFTALQTINLSGEQLALGSAGANSGVMSFAGSTSGKVTLQAAAAAGTYTLTLPTSAGTSNQVLTTNGSGVLSWSTVSGGGTPGGADTQLQYNSSGSFAGASGLTTNGTNLTLGSTSQLLWSTDLILTRRAAANLRLGAADDAAPVAQTLSVQSVVAGTTNTAGANLTITGSQGTGTGAGGSIVFQVAPAGSSGTAQNALATALTINPQTTTVAGAVFAGSTTVPRGNGYMFPLSGSYSVGIYNPADYTIQFAMNSQFSGGAAGAYLGLQYQMTQCTLSWGLSSLDIVLARDAANTLALRNGANAQTFRVYNTTNGTNSEFGSIKWNSNVLEIGTETAGSGTARLVKYFVGPTSTNTFITRATSAQQIQFVCNGSVNGAFGVQSGASVGSSHVGLSLGSADYGSATISSINFGVTLYINPGVMGNSSRDGAHVYIQGGTASTVGNWNGGSVYLDGGALNGAGAAGNVIIGSTRGNLQIADARDVVLGTTTGTKIGTATTQKIGFYNKTPVVQPTAVADATDAATAITQLNALLSRMRDLGLIAT